MMDHDEYGGLDEVFVKYGSFYQIYGCVVTDVWVWIWVWVWVWVIVLDSSQTCVSSFL